MREEHEEELEVLQSIYEGDPSFTMINNTTFQYKYGETGDNKSFLVEITWGPDYPDAVPTVSLDLFYNKHIVPTVKEKILSGLQEQAKINLGMSMTFTLFEWLKEAKDELLEEQPSEVSITTTTSELSTDIAHMTVDEQAEPKREKKEQLTKAQKRRMWDRQNAAGERARGYNWVDIIKHLSQTGPSTKNDG